jgi:uncharacterized protein YjbI with pentapeptide repeats
VGPRYAQLQGANLSEAGLQGANLSEARLQGTNLSGTDLQGADLSDSQLKLTLISDAYVWRTRHVNCSDARVTRPKFDVPDRVTIKILLSAVHATQEARKRLNDGLVATIPKDDLAAI